jgi:hypothetical protein
VSDQQADGEQQKAHGQRPAHQEREHVPAGAGVGHGDERREQPSQRAASFQYGVQRNTLQMVACSRSSTVAARRERSPTTRTTWWSACYAVASHASSRPLLDGGRGPAVIQQRMEFQEVMRDRFAGVIEDATGRPVIGFMSGNQQHPDMMCAVFILGPSDLVDEHELQHASGGSGLTA